MGSKIAASHIPGIITFVHFLQGEWSDHSQKAIYLYPNQAKNATQESNQNEIEIQFA